MPTLDPTATVTLTLDGKTVWLGLVVAAGAFAVLSRDAGVSDRAFRFLDWLKESPVLVPAAPGAEVEPRERG